MSFSTETSVGGLCRWHGDTGRGRFGKSSNRSGGRSGENWCQPVYCVAAVGTRKGLTSSQGHLIPWSAWEGMEWDGSGTNLCSVDLSLAARGGGEKRTATFSSLSLSAPLNCCCWDHQTSSSGSQYFLITPLIVILPYIPVLRLIKTWRNYLISIGPAKWKKCLPIIWLHWNLAEAYHIYI